MAELPGMSPSLSFAHSRTLGVLLHAPTHVPQRLEARWTCEGISGRVWSGLEPRGARGAGGCSPTPLAVCVAVGHGKQRKPRRSPGQRVT